MASNKAASGRRSLLIIDDAKIREQAFKSADKILKKIDKVELSLENFNRQDQQLFSQWFDLEFRDDQKRIEGLDSSYYQLGKFHNWIVATSEQLNISMPAAFRLMKEEQALYEAGDASTKERIEKDRELRDKFIQGQISHEFSEAQADYDEFDDFDFADESEDEREDEDEDAFPPRSKQEQQIFEQIQTMTDKKIRKICGDIEGATALLGTIMALGGEKEEFELFLRTWNLCSHKIRQAFAQDFRDKTGESLNSIIEQMKEKIAANRTDSKHETNHDQGSASFEEAISPNHEEHIKLIYRKLVRRLHPDKQTVENLKLPWQAKVWAQLQKAYNERNLATLQSIYTFTLLRLKDLSELTISEILDSCKWLSEQQQTIEQQVVDLRKLPAWGFSQKKNHNSLARKIRKDFEKSFASIQERIDELQSQHAILEQMAKHTIQRSRTNQGSRKARKTARRRPRPKNINENFGQESFY